MRRTKGMSHRIPALLACAWLSGCTLLLQFDPAELREETPDRCQDGVDNDENGLTDCAEPTCQVFGFCQEQTEAACRDRSDNDRDGLTDCLDPDCHAYLRCNESLQGACQDGMDNNGDGLVDCADFTCRQDPHCCTLVAPLLDDALTAGPAAAAVRTCDASQTGSSVNGFDPDRWVAFGAPAPRPTHSGTGLDPNQCGACFDTGLCDACHDAVLLSTEPYAVRPGLTLSAWLRVESDPHARAGLALTGQTVVSELGGCADARPSFFRRIGVDLVPDPQRPGWSLASFVVDDEVVDLESWPALRAQATMLVDPDGFVRFYLRSDQDPIPSLNEPERFRAPSPVDLSGPPLYLALHGRGIGLRVERGSVRDQGRCFNPALAPPPGTGATPLLTPGPGWDHAMVADPSVFYWHDAWHLLYVGRASVQGAGALGHAVSTQSGTEFERVTVDAPLVDGEQVAAWLTEIDPGRQVPATVDLSGPTVLVRDHPADGALLIYLAVSEREGDAVQASWILGLITYDLVHFNPLRRDVEAPAEGAPESSISLLSGADPDAAPWEVGVGSPDVVERGPQDLVLFYAGRSDPNDPFTSAIGVATSPDGVHWERGNPIGYEGQAGLNAPVMAPPGDALIQTSLSDPSGAWDPTLQIFHLWYVRRQGGEFSIRYAHAGYDGNTVVDFPGNPVLRPAPGPACDDLYLDGPSVSLDPSGRVQLYYHGRSETGGHGICYAVNEIGR